MIEAKHAMSVGTSTLIVQSLEALGVRATAIHPSSAFCDVAFEVHCLASRQCALIRAASDLLPLGRFELLFIDTFKDSHESNPIHGKMPSHIKG